MEYNASFLLVIQDHIPVRIKYHTATAELAVVGMWVTMR